MADKPYRDEDTLREMYYSDDMTLQEIADEFGVAYKTIHSAFEDNDIPRRSSAEALEVRGTRKSTGAKDGVHRDEEWLREKYFDEKMTVGEMGEAAGVSEATIIRQMDNHGLERRTSGVTNQLRNLGAGFTHADHGGHELIRHTVKDTSVYMKHHRLIAIAKYGVDAVKDKIVHHKNGVPWDNRHSNLELMDQSDHIKHHQENGDMPLEGRPDAERDEKGRFIN